MAQCRWQNQSKAADFWEDPPNTENFCCTQNGLLDFYIYEKGFIWCPSESRLRPVSPKRSNCVLHSSKVYLHAHLAFQARYFKWAWNCFKWTMAAFFKTVYLGEQTVEWLKSELFLLMMKRNRVQLLGMTSALLQAKCWDVDFWHIVELGELLVL